MITSRLELNFICFISMSSISFFDTFFLWLMKRIDRAKQDMQIFSELLGRKTAQVVHLFFFFLELY